MTVTILLEWLAALALVFLFAIGALFTRRVAIRRRGGTFDCSLRLTPGSARAAVHFGARTATSAAGGAGPTDQAQAQVQSQGQGQGQAHDEDHAHARLRAAERGTRTPLSASAVRAGRGWAYGIAQYENDRIDWFRIFSYAYRPAAVLTRRDLEVLGRRDAVGHDELALFPGWAIVECRFGTGPRRAGHVPRRPDRLPLLARSRPARPERQPRLLTSASKPCASVPSPALGLSAAGTPDGCPPTHPAPRPRPGARPLRGLRALPRTRCALNAALPGSAG